MYHFLIVLFIQSATFSMTYTFADPRDESIERDLPTWIPEDHLCLFKLGKCK